jgi:hypothetical protein
LNIKITRLLQYCIAIILLTGTVLLSLPAPASAFSPDALIIRDNLTDPDGGWPVDINVSEARSFTDNGYSIYVQRPGWVSKCTNRKIGELADFIVEVDIKESALPKSDGYVGLRFRIQDDQNYYAFMINNNNRTFRIVNFKGGPTPTVLRDWTTSNYINPENSTNRLRIVCEGPRIDAYCNEYLLWTGTDTSIPKGFLGFQVESYQGLQGYLFSNLVVYRGVKAAFIADDSFKETSALSQSQQSARQLGFTVVDTVEYYPASTSDYSSHINKLMSREPVVVYIMCRPPARPEFPSACDAINSALKSRGVDVRYYEESNPNSLEFSVIKPTTSEATYRGGQTLQIFTGINNTGVQDIALATVTLNITDPDGTRLPTTPREWKTIPAGKESRIPISYDLPLFFLKAGEYTASVEITGYPDAANRDLSRTENATVTFEVVESISTINYVALLLFALLTGAMIAWLVTRRKSSKE